MPTSSDRSTSRWQSYACSRTVVKDAEFDPRPHRRPLRYNDLYKAFARNVLFIPNQAAGGSATDRNCGNDVTGYWVPIFAVVDFSWAKGTFPDTKKWDSACYVVPTSSAHLAGPPGGAGQPG
eukprot:jgi/Mesvir1/5686/Mv15701-RA.1